VPEKGTDETAALDTLWWEAVGPPETPDDVTEGFVTLGGYSLAAARLVAEVRDRVGVDLPLTMLLRDNASLTDVRAFVAAQSASDAKAGATPISVDAGAAQASWQAETTAATAGGAAETVAAAGDDGRATADGQVELPPSLRRLWLIDRLHPEASAYNVIAAWSLRGSLDADRLRGALADVVARHEALRAEVDASDPLRPMLRYRDTAVPEFDVRDVTAPIDVGAVVREVGEKPLPTGRAPLLRAELRRVGDEALLVLCLHHMVGDQRSVDVVAADLAEAYRARADGDAPRWGAPASYRRYADAERALVGGPLWRKHLDYWRALLAEPPPNRPLPFGLPAPATPSLRGGLHAAGLDAEASERLRRFARDNGVTPATVFLAGLALVVSTWTGDDRIVVGIPVSRRTEVTEQDVVGFLVETLPVLLEPLDGADAGTLLHHVRDRYLAAMAHAGPTFDAIVEALDVPARPFGSPLFRVWFNDLTRGAPPPDCPEVEVVPRPTSGHAALFDVNAYVHGDGDGYLLHLVHAIDRVRDDVAAELAAQWVLALRLLADTPARPPRDLSLRTDVIGTAPEPVTAAAPRRDGGTVRTPFGELGAPELEAAVADVTARLRAAGAGPGDVVEIQARRAGGLAVALLAARRAVAVAALVDADTPETLRDERRARLRPAAVLNVAADTTAGVEITATGVTPRNLPGASHILFTTGTGGRAAAVVTSRTALRAALDWYHATFTPTADDVVALLAGVGHDPVLRDLLVPLESGGLLAVPDENVLGEPRALLEFLYTNGVTILHGTPALLELVVAGFAGAPWLRLDRLRLVISSGAALTGGVVAGLRRFTDAAVVNGYGTTETPQIAAYHRVETDDAGVVPLGRGAGGNELLVLDRDGAVAAVGRLGDIVVRGPGLADGYLDDDRGGRFVTDGPGVRTFRTGDLGRRDPSGLVHFAGRGDRQLAVDGFRVAPEEIEAAALRFPGLRQAAAGLIDSPAGPVLTLRVVPSDGAEPDLDALRRHLRGSLPRHAVPRNVATVSRLHTNANHKVLLVPLSPSPSGRSAAGDDDAAWLLALLREVVGRDVGPDENFFDAGLTSMTLLRLHAKIIENIPDPLPPTTLFAYPSAGALARHLGGREPLDRRRRRSVDLGQVSAEAQERREARRRRTSGTL
jgi:non-ribosomal peptide synthetase component F